MRRVGGEEIGKIEIWLKCGWWKKYISQSGRNWACGPIIIISSLEMKWR